MPGATPKPDYRRRLSAFICGSVNDPLDLRLSAQYLGPKGALECGDSPPLWS